MPQMIFVLRDGSKKTVSVPEGQTLLDIAHANHIDVEGLCGGSLACATCHLVIAEEWYHRLPPPEEEERDMLELAWGLEETSRLGCQIAMSAELDGLVVRLPDET